MLGSFHTDREARTMARTSIKTAEDFIGEAQDILDRAVAESNKVLIDIYTREVAIRTRIVAEGK